MQLCPSGEAAASALAEFAEAFNAEATDKIMYDVLQASRASGSITTRPTVSGHNDNRRLANPAQMRPRRPALANHSRR
eukprot:6561573-Prymnesium_polylepis.1